MLHLLIKQILIFIVHIHHNLTSSLLKLHRNFFWISVSCSSHFDFSDILLFRFFQRGPACFMSLYSYFLSSPWSLPGRPTSGPALLLDAQIRCVYFSSQIICSGPGVRGTRSHTPRRWCSRLEWPGSGWAPCLCRNPAGLHFWSDMRRRGELNVN